MVKTIMSPIARAKTMGDYEIVRVANTTYEDSEIEEMKRMYHLQNSMLARKNEELMGKVGRLERELFDAQRQILKLRNEKISMQDKLELNSRRFHDLIVDQYAMLMREYRGFMCDVGVNLGRGTAAGLIFDKVNEEGVKNEESFEFNHYWSKVNEDLARRKSIISKRCIESTQVADSDVLDTLVEAPEENNNEVQVQEEQVGSLGEKEDVYEDHDSTLIPVKRDGKRMDRLEKEIDDVPLLQIENAMQESTPEEEHIPQVGGDDLELPCVGRNAMNIDDIADMEIKEGKKPRKKYITKRERQQRRTSIPRELKNLDTEKTKRWIGMDLDEEVQGDSIGERRKSRRRSLVVDYHLTSRRKGARASVDVDQENRITKGKRVNRKPLRDVTNLGNGNSSYKGNGSSIFDLEEMDLFAEYV